MIINVNKHFNVDVHAYSYIYLEGFRLTTLVRKPNDFGRVLHLIGVYLKICKSTNQHQTF